MIGFLLTKEVYEDGQIHEVPVKVFTSEARAIAYRDAENKKVKHLLNGFDRLPMSIQTITIEVG